MRSDSGIVVVWDELAEFITAGFTALETDPYARSWWMMREDGTTFTTTETSVVDAALTANQDSPTTVWPIVLMEWSSAWIQQWPRTAEVVWSIGDDPNRCPDVWQLACDEQLNPLLRANLPEAAPKTVTLDTE